MHNAPDASSRRVRHFVISGTNYWNPGDDFVRDGVIHVLRQSFPGDHLNFHFYNFGEDQFPKSKFRGLGNEVSAGDLDQLRDFLDGVIIAGLSAGNEIKDLYNWVLANGLEDRVYLIGAGYENSYCAQHVLAEPEATIFRKARIIVGRTEKHPGFIDEAGTPYVHLNCPALLSVPEVKPVTPGRKLQRIGFSIQLPHETGIVNQSCDMSVHRLACQILMDLARTHEVEVVAHHKSEYFLFLKLLRGTGVPVLYSSFYQDLHEVYRRYDGVITTRLHSSLYANGHGIPGIIVNDTDRHTHTLSGFPHSVWVNTREAFDRELARLHKADLAQIATEMKAFKQRLTERYVRALAPLFTSPRPEAATDARQELAAGLKSALGNVEIKQRVLDVLSRLTADHWLENNREDYRRAIAAQAGWFDTPTFLNWFARNLRPRHYLEVGVRRGRSLSQVLTESPDTDAYGFDLWIPDYGSLPEQGIVTSNPGPEFVRAELRRLGVRKSPAFIVGSSHDTLRPFFDEASHPQNFDLLLIDGDHSDAGALRDLEVAFSHVAPGGAIVFDDTRNSAHPGLQGVWDAFKALHPDFLFLEDTHRTGTAVAIRPPFKRLAEALAAPAQPAITVEPYQFDSERKEQLLVRSLVRPGMTVLDVGAHVGKYTKLFSLLVGEQGRVFAFEPTPASARTLAERIEADSLNNVTLVRKAVCDRNGVVTLHQFPEEYSSWNGLGRPTMEDPRDQSKLVPIVGETEVASVTLDTFCRIQELERIDYLKLDVEGAEIHALHGAEDLLRRQAIGCLQFEVSRKMLDGLGTRARDVFALLASHGYECHAIGEDGKLGPVATDSDAFFDNYVAFPVKVQESINPATDLPVHFFTIVLNGEPFIRQHIRTLSQLPFDWHWHIIEGVAELKHDTGWSVAGGGRVPESFHRQGLSVDGTSEYLNELKQAFPDRISIHRPPAGRFWDGKREMVNAPLNNITRECLVWQLDSDELWTTSQIIRARALFQAHPEKTAALFYCHYFVGPDRVITSRDTYGNHTSFEWLRVWRFQPGDRWVAHEPPRLGRAAGNGAQLDVGSINPFRHAETEAMGLVFQHFAYATEAQVRFKQDYYGYAGAVEQWRKLQAETNLPCRLADYFAWVKDGAAVDSAASRHLVPMVDLTGPHEVASRNTVEPQRILFVRTDSIGDAVMASSMLEPIHQRYPQAQIAVLCQQHVAELFVRSPHVHAVICYERVQAETEGGQQELLRDIAQFNPDLILNSVRSRDSLSETLTHLFTKAPRVGLECDLNNASAEARDAAARLYETLIPAAASNVELDHHAAFLRGLGIPASNLRPVVWTDGEDEQLAEAFFRQQGLDPLRTMALFPFTQHDLKNYPHFAQALREFTGWNFLVFGGAESEATAEALTRVLPGPGVNLAGRTSLREMAALIRRCRILVGSDSCGAHLACAVGVPNVVVLGGGHFGRFLPYSALTSAVCQPLACYHCNWSCGFGTYACTKEISPALVAEAIHRTLAGPSLQPRLFVPNEGATTKADGPRPAPVGNFIDLKSVEVIEVGQAPSSAAKGPAGGFKVSAIVSTYNSEAYLLNCLRDLAAQTLYQKGELEIIVINSGSPQGEEAIVREFQKTHPNVVYLRTERETLYAAWNRGVQMARGRFITNANADDSHRPDALEVLAAALEKNPSADLAYGDYYTTHVANDSFESMTPLRLVSHPPYHPATLLFYCVTGCHPMWRRDVFRKIGLFDPEFTAPGDYEFVLRLARNGLQAVHVPEPISLFYQNAEGLSFKSKERSEREFNSIQGRYRREMPIERIFQVNPADPASVSCGWTALGNYALNYEAPWFDNASQDAAYAIECFNTALRHDLTNEVARFNLFVATLLQGQPGSADAAQSMLSQMPSELAERARTMMSNGRFAVLPVALPPAVAPLSYRPSGEPDQAEATAAGESAQSIPAELGAVPQGTIRWLGKFFDTSDLAAAARGIVPALAGRLDMGSLDASAYDEFAARTLSEAPRDRLRESFRRYPYLRGGIGIAHGVPAEFQAPADPALRVGWTSSSQDRIPLSWAKACQRMDEIWVPTSFHLEVFAQAGVPRTRLAMMPTAVDTEGLNPEKVSPLDLPQRAQRNFLAFVDASRESGWDAVLTAYAEEFSGVPDVCLFLLPDAIHHKTDVVALEKQVREFLSALKHNPASLPRVEWLGATVRQDRWPRLMRAVDAVLLPRRTEAWGVRALEAMALGCAVIGTDWGGQSGIIAAPHAWPVAWTPTACALVNADGWMAEGGQWAEPSLVDLRAHLRRAYAQPESLVEVRRQARSFVVEHHAAAKVAGLVCARLACLESGRLSTPLPAEIAPQAGMASVRLTWEGTFHDLGSLSHVNREITAELERQNGVQLHRVAIDSKSPAHRPAEVTVRHAWPPNWERPAQGAWVLVQPWEFGVLPTEWVRELAGVDEIWVPSEYVRRVYLDSGVPAEKVRRVPNGIDPERFHPGVPALPLKTTKSFKFLFVGGTIRRKGPDLLLESYLRQFTAADDVCLVVKDFGGRGVYAGQTMEAQIRAAQARPNAPEILHLTDDLSPEQMAGLYTACDCLVHPYRGEGFALPVLEAMACGRPVIVTAGGSTEDFARPEFAWRVPARRQPLDGSVGGLPLAGRGWLLEPDTEILGASMRDAAGDAKATRARGLAASDYARREWTWEKAAVRAAELARDLTSRRAGQKPAVRQSAHDTATFSRPAPLPEVARLGQLDSARQLLAQKLLAEAWAETLRALQARPFHPAAWLLLGEIALAAGDGAKARHCGEQAKALAPAWKPGKEFLKRSFKSAQTAAWAICPPVSAKPRLSVCLIARNEEKFLPSCLKSLAGLADQIVVVDTGSTDRTLALAREAGAVVREARWSDDFSAARNLSLELATGDWVLILDADEELTSENIQKLREDLARASVMAYRLPIQDVGKEDEGCHYIPRLFRNAPGLHFTGRIHEQVFPSLEPLRQEFGLENKLGTATILHHGYTAEVTKSRDKVARNLHLLQLALADSPDDANLLMNLGLELSRSGQTPAGLEAYDQAWRVLSKQPANSVPAELRETLLVQFCTHLLRAGHVRQLLELCQSPAARPAEGNASLHFLRGFALLKLNRPLDAAEQFRRCLARRNQPSLTTVHKEIHGVAPRHCLALALVQAGELEAAAHVFAEALPEAPESKALRFDYANFLVRVGAPVEALQLLHELSQSSPEDPAVWQLGGKIALSQPEFLEVALDWTETALRQLPAAGAIGLQRAEALLLAGRLKDARLVWGEYHQATNPAHLAALLILDCACGHRGPAIPQALQAEVSGEVLRWFRRSLQYGAEAVLRGLELNLELLRARSPEAAAQIQSIFSHAGTEEVVA